MAESLKDVINKLKQQTSQVSKPEIKPAPVQVAEDELDEEDEIEENDALYGESNAESKKTDPKQQEKLNQIMIEIEMLQNNGRFRAELLHQMQEINNALVVIAGALANLGKK